VAQANNQQASNNNQGYAKEFKSTIDFNLKVDPPDMRAMFMNYLNEIDLGKQLVKQMENHYGNNKALAGNTPSAKINFV
jgi:hypothetical protein